MSLFSNFLLVSLYTLIATALAGAAAILLWIEIDIRLARLVPVPQREPLLHRLGDAVSQLGNVVIFKGHQNHSISGDAWLHGRHRTMRLANWLFRSPLHCRHAHLKDVYLADQLINRTPPELLAEARQLFGQEVGR